jgi:hypothetical protein
MTFSLLAPAALAAGISLFVIYVLHIRRQTPPSRRVPSLRFWSAADASVTDRQRFQLPPITLSLLLQLLVATLVTLALARPALSGSLAALGDRSEPEHVIVIIDGSTSMLGRGPDDGTRWDAAKANALETLGQWSTGDVVTILVAANVVTSRSASNESQRDDVREWLRGLAAPGGRAAIDRALDTAGNLRLPDRRNSIHLLTDGAIFPSPDVVRTLGMPIELISLADQETTSNVAITSIGARQIAGSTRQYAIAFQVTNFSPTTADVPWTTTADRERIAANTIFLSPGESRLVTVNLPVDARSATVALGYDDALAADNTAAITVGATDAGSRRILLLSDAPSAVLRALQAIPGSSVQVYSPSTPGLTGLASGFDLLVSEGYLPPAADRPQLPSLFIQPAANGEDIAISGALTDPTLTYLDSRAPELVDVDLSGVTWGTVPVYQVPADATSIAAVTAGGQQAPLIWRGTWNEQPWIATAFAVPETNIATRVAFPILVSRIVESLMQPTVPASITAGDPLDIPAAEDIATIAVTLPEGSVTRLGTVPGGGATFATTGTPGTYTIDLLRSDGSVRSSLLVTANAGDPVESDLAPNPGLGEIVTLATDTSTSTSGSAETSGELWRVVTLALLAILMLEWFVSNRASLGRRVRGATA